MLRRGGEDFMAGRRLEFTVVSNGSSDQRRIGDRRRHPSAKQEAANMQAWHQANKRRSRGKAKKMEVSE